MATTTPTSAAPDQALPPSLLTSLHILTYLPYILAGIIVFVSTIFAIYTAEISIALFPFRSFGRSMTHEDGVEGEVNGGGGAAAMDGDVGDCSFHSDKVEKRAMYRRSRDEFLGNERAGWELGAWKRGDDGVEFREINGLVNPDMVGEYSNGPGHPPAKWKKCDSYFTDFPLHNPPSLILSSTPHSLIIANRSIHDCRQYPSNLFPSRYPTPGSSPEGQGFGHMLVIPHARIFNVVDPEAVEDDCAVVKELVEHFVRFWEGGDQDGGGNDKEIEKQAQQNRHALLERMKEHFEQANKAREEAARAIGGLEEERKAKALTREMWEEWSGLQTDLLKLKARNQTSDGNDGDEGGDFVMGFHAWKHNSIGHLHLHVFPRSGRFRKWSARKHDWKTVEVGDVLAVESSGG